MHTMQYVFIPSQSCLLYDLLLSTRRTSLLPVMHTAGSLSVVVTANMRLALRMLKGALCSACQAAIQRVHCSSAASFALSAMHVQNCLMLVLVIAGQWLEWCSRSKQQEKLQCLHHDLPGSSHQAGALAGTRLWPTCLEKWRGRTTVAGFAMHQPRPSADACFAWLKPSSNMVWSCSTSCLHAASAQRNLPGRVSRTARPSCLPRAARGCWKASCPAVSFVAPLWQNRPSRGGGRAPHGGCHAYAGGRRRAPWAPRLQPRGA